MAAQVPEVHCSPTVDTGSPPPDGTRRAVSRSEWFDGPAGPGGGTSRPEGGDGPGPGGPARQARRRRGQLGTTLVVLLVLVVVGGIAADIATDIWWYDSVGFRGVFV